MNPRKLLAAVGAAGATLTLAACLPSGPNDAPACDIPAGSNTGQCAWGVNYQNQAHGPNSGPMVWIRYQRHGENFFRESPHQNCNSFYGADGVCRLYVYSPTGFASIGEQSGPS